MVVLEVVRPADYIFELGGGVEPLPRRCAFAVYHKPLREVYEMRARVERGLIARRAQHGINSRRGRAFAVGPHDVDDWELSLRRAGLAHKARKTGEPGAYARARELSQL